MKRLWVLTLFTLLLAAACSPAGSSSPAANQPANGQTITVYRSPS